MAEDDNGVEWIKPPVHGEWQLMRVISGHTGWVRCLSVDPSNAWFASGSADRTIKIWDLATGSLKLTLTGHISPIRGLKVSLRHPILFSVGEDRMVKAWDLETNAVTRQYHGHLHGVWAVDVHPELDLLVTGGRDATARLWDIRTRKCIHTLTGHKDNVSSLFMGSCGPQIVTGSMDSTIRLWDIRMGTTLATLTHHKKGVRALTTLMPHEYTFASGAADRCKRFALPHGTFVLNYEDAENNHELLDTPCNALAVNEDGVLAGGFDDGTLRLWDYYGGKAVQVLRSPPQPGSLDCENGVLGVSFDRSGFRLLTAEMDKTIKMYCPLDEEEMFNANNKQDNAQ